MASLGHIAVGLAAGRLDAQRRISGLGLAAAMALYSGLSLLPDADVVAFALGIPYHAPWGHRGASHSVALGLALGLLVGFGAAALGRSPWRVALLAGLVTASHGLLDALTDGGLGIALLWPWSTERIFAPWQPIPVAPIGLGMLSRRGLEVLLTELVYFAPLWVWALLPRRVHGAPGGPAALPPT